MGDNVEREVGLCPVVERAFALLGKKWTGLIIHVLGTKERRFTDLLNEITDMSSRILAERLRELECEGIVKRVVIPETPVRIEYSLTEKGVALLPLMRGVADWAHEWAPKVIA